MASSVKDLKKCCLGRFGSVVKTKVGCDPESFFTTKPQSILRAFVSTVRIHIAPLEDKHARNKKHNTSQDTWANFAAKYVIAESKQAMHVAEDLAKLAARVRRPINSASTSSAIGQADVVAGEGGTAAPLVVLPTLQR